MAKTKESVDLSDLKLDDDHAKAILAAAIEAEAYNEDMPKTKKERINAAAEQIGMMLDAWINNGVTPDADDEEVAAMGETIKEILELAGVEVDEDGDVEFGELPDLEEDADDDDDSDDDDDDADGDEAAVDINDIIKGYEDLSAASRVKAIKKLELDAEDDDDYNTARDIAEWEENQDQPSSRVLSWLEENGFGAEEEVDGEAEDDDDADEPAEADESDGDDDQPWSKSDGFDKDYDDMSAAEIRKVLDKLFKDGDLQAEQVEYVKEYEEGREKPPTRSNVIKKCDELLAKLEEAGDDKDDDDEDEKPARSSRRRRGAKSTDPDDSDDADDAVARDDEKESRSNGKLVLTRDQIIAALTTGKVTIKL